MVGAPLEAEFDPEVEIESPEAEALGPDVPELPEPADAPAPPEPVAPPELPAPEPLSPLDSPETVEDEPWPEPAAAEPPCEGRVVVTV